MPAEEKPSSKFFWIIASGVVSLGVGVASALVITHLTDNAPDLTYDVTSLESFPGETQKLGFIALRIENHGGKEVEELQCRIDMKNAKLKEPRINGLSAAAPKTVHDASYVKFSVPFLNPKEAFSIQLLVEPEDGKLEVPDIDIRGRGVVAKLQTTEPKNSLGFPEILFPIVATIVAALTTARTGIQRLMGRAGGGIGVEQRDGFAFLLGLHGFTEEADQLRQSTRDYSWWTLSDALTERLLNAGHFDLESIRRGMDVLSCVADQSHGIARESKAIVHTNLARLAQASGDSLSAKRHSEAAIKCDKTAALHRTKMLTALR